MEMPSLHLHCCWTRRRCFHPSVCLFFWCTHLWLNTQSASPLRPATPKSASSVWCFIKCHLYPFLNRNLLFKIKMKMTALIFNVTNLCHKSCVHRQTGKKILPKLQDARNSACLNRMATFVVKNNSM